MYKPDIIAVLEPRISGITADDVCTRIGRKNWIRVEADGFSGGVWILWEEDTIKVRMKHVHKQFVHLIINPGRNEEWAQVHGRQKESTYGRSWETFMYPLLGVLWGTSIQS